jgi:hypothetical protein
MLVDGADDDAIRAEALEPSNFVVDRPGLDVHVHTVLARLGNRMSGCRCLTWHQFGHRPSGRTGVGEHAGHQLPLPTPPFADFRESLDDVLTWLAGSTGLFRFLELRSQILNDGRKLTP